MAKNNRINEWNENEMFSLIKIAQEVLNASSIKKQYIKKKLLFDTTKITASPRSSYSKPDVVSIQK